MHQIHVPDSLLEEVKIKLKYARLDDGMANVEWNDLEIGHSAFKEVVEFWRDKYDWREYETFLNTFNHFKAPIQVDGFELLDIHFLHYQSSRQDAIPLIFVHGWSVHSGYHHVKTFAESLIGLDLSLRRPSFFRF